MEECPEPHPNNCITAFALFIYYPRTQTERAKLKFTLFIDLLCCLLRRLALLRIMYTNPIPRLSLAETPAHTDYRFPVNAKLIHYTTPLPLCVSCVVNFLFSHLIGLH